MEGIGLTADRWQVVLTVLLFLMLSLGFSVGRRL